MDNMYREAADPPGEYNPKEITREMSVWVKKKTAVGFFFFFWTTGMNISLTSPAVLVLLSSNFATSVNSLVKKMSSGITGIYTITRIKVNYLTIVILKQRQNWTLYVENNQMLILYHDI